MIQVIHVEYVYDKVLYSNSIAFEVKSISAPTRLQNTFDSKS